MNAKSTRSTLLNHCFPPFYACYLLKSIRTPKATATYIGSTPSPPRRIRQHNGEITQGAWKTRHNRPWVMQMIVHGFPSKLAALQFEWAWQHPHISRHLRDEDGKNVYEKKGRAKYLRSCIQVAHNMVSSHPYNTWPLHVKLFTEEATKVWKDLLKASNMPEGMTYSVELEGVDGKSGKPGTGRTAPIDVQDSRFTSLHLAKAQRLNGQQLTCAVCKDPIEDFATKPLETSLCPTDVCSSVAHLRCLATHFLSSPSTSSATPLIPRGGNCPSCDTYILWGDVIRGCYRRHKGGAEVMEDDDEEPDNSQGESEPEDAPVPTQAKKRGRPKGSGKKTKTLENNAESAGGEVFDLSAVSPSSSEVDEPAAKPPTRPRKRASPTQKPSRASKTKSKVPPTFKSEALDALAGASSDSDISLPSVGKLLRGKSKSPAKATAKASKSQKRILTPDPEDDLGAEIADAMSTLSVSSDGDLPVPTKLPSPPKRKHAREYIELSD